MRATRWQGSSEVPSRSPACRADAASRPQPTGETIPRRSRVCPARGHVHRPSTERRGRPSIDRLLRSGSLVVYYRHLAAQTHQAVPPADLFSEDETVRTSLLLLAFGATLL